MCGAVDSGDCGRDAMGVLGALSARISLGARPGGLSGEGGLGNGRGHCGLMRCWKSGITHASSNF